MLEHMCTLLGLFSQCTGWPHRSGTPSYRHFETPYPHHPRDETSNGEEGHSWVLHNKKN